MRGRLADPAEALVRGWPGCCRRTSWCTGPAPAPDGFDARFGAVFRRYVYRLADDPQRVDPLRRGHVVRHRLPLDAAAMAAAAAPLTGPHDFAAFCKPRPEATTVRTLDRAHGRPARRAARMRGW